MCCIFYIFQCSLKEKKLWEHHAVYIVIWNLEPVKFSEKLVWTLYHYTWACHISETCHGKAAVVWYDVFFFFSITVSMAFIVKCAPVLKEWNFCCCSCSLRAASVVLAWIITVSPFKLICWTWRGSVYGQKFWVVICYLGYQKNTSENSDGTVKTSVALPGYSAAYQLQKDCKIVTQEPSLR